MENKCEITDICKRLGVTLHRIRAIRDCGDVKAGGLGGWIENGRNLSQEGDCWVCGRVNPRGNAEVSQANDYLTISPIGSRRGCTTFFRAADGSVFVRCGCFFGTIEQFEEAVESTHGDNKHGQAYRKAIELAKLQIGE